MKTNSPEEYLIEQFNGLNEQPQLLKQLEEINPFRNTTARRSGNTVRLIDKYVQYLFNNNYVIAVDHWCTPDNPEINKTASEYLATQLISRLMIELKITKQGSNFGVTKLPNGYKMLRFNTVKK